VLGFHVELAVVATQRPQIVVELLRVPDRLHGRDDRVQQAGTLHVHLHREQVSQVGARQEHARIEVAGDLVLMLLDEGPALLEQACQVSHA
jgi:hypothetical protein